MYKRGEKLPIGEVGLCHIFNQYGQMEVIGGYADLLEICLLTKSKS